MKEQRLRELKLGQPRRLTAGLNDHEHPAVSPDGRLIAYYAGPYGAIQLYVADIRGRLARVVSPLAGNSTQPAWHPTQPRVAYRHQSSSDSKWELWETALFGDDVQPRQVLAHPDFHFKHPYYDATGARLVYFSDQGSPGVFHLWMWELNQDRRRQLTFGNQRMDCHPVFSPDGRRLVFHAYRGTDENAVPAVTNLFALDLHSGQQTQLTSGEDQYKHPFFIDDDVISYHFESNTDGRRRLGALHLASGLTVELTDGSNNDKHAFPFRDAKGRLKLAWCSKKLGEELPQEKNSWDIFIARLK